MSIENEKKFQEALDNCKGVIILCQSDIEEAKQKYDDIVKHNNHVIASMNEKIKVLERGLKNLRNGKINV